MTGETLQPPLLTRIVQLFLRGDVTIMLIVIAMILGFVALVLTPREEEPQIVVPMADVFVSAPGLSAHEIEQQVTLRLEKLLYQVDGVEYLYSMSKPGQCIVTVRFYVGEDREDSLVKLYNKVQSNVDRIPATVESWVVKPIEVDDVPILNITLWSDQPAMYGDYELRRLAEQLQFELQAVQNTNRVEVIGGRPRRMRIELQPAKLAGFNTSALQVAQALRSSNINVDAGTFEQQNNEFIVEAGTFLKTADDLKQLVVNVLDNQPVYLKHIADVTDGPAEVDNYTWIGFGPAAQNPYHSKDQPKANVDESNAIEPGQLYPSAHVSVAKRKGSNAVWVANSVESRMRQLADPLSPDRLLPAGVHYRITRDYGETANAKVTDLIKSLGIAVLTVIALIGLVMGWRTAIVIALAIPVCYSITLFINLLTGYTINRVTLFALILALGLLVDDPITGVENIERYLKMWKWSVKDAVLRAIQEVQPALILSTLAIIASFLPLMFITGMMGPYMGPMALNVPLTVTVSTVVAIVITPWIAMVFLRKLGEKGERQEYDVTKQPLYRASNAVLGRIIDSPTLTWLSLGAVVVLLLVAMALPAFRVVPLKMLPYDNKNEFQIVVDMPEGTTLEETEAVSRQLGNYLATVAEVRDYQLYVGTASAMDFNGMVRHYFLRRGSNVADIRVNLAAKERRSDQSHTMLLRLRDDLTAIADQHDANIKLVEVPPGPPVISTITAEVYGPADTRYDDQIAVAKRVQKRLAREPLVVDVDISAEADQQKWVFETDQPKAALSAISKENIAQTLQIALDGMRATVLHPPGEVNPLWAELRVARSDRSSIEDLENLYVQGQQGQMVQLGALGKFENTYLDETPIFEDKTIYHKNLQRVVYVFGEVAGRPPADAILDMQFDQQPAGTNPTPAEPSPWEQRTWFNPGGGDPWAIPEGYSVRWAGEGEWQITLDVFRDLGLAFAAAQIGIFIILMFQTGSRLLPLVIMLAIPLTMIGIMPGFWLLNAVVDRPIGPSGYPNPVFFTATAMIGMIALGGIVVRNSVVLIDFINQSIREGLSRREAVIQSVAVRTRPILLTAATTLLGNWVITLDPIFSGLAWAIIFGILTSTLFTLLVIPIVYWVLYGEQETA